MFEKTIEALSNECDRLTKEVADLHKMLDHRVAADMKKFDTGDRVVYIQSGGTGIVQRFIPNGLVEVTMDGSDGISLLHCKDLIRDGESINLTFNTARKMIEVCEILQAGMYGATDASISSQAINEILEEVRGKEKNIAVINRIKARTQKAAPCQSH